jgi:ATP-binding cassette subfamily B protein
MARHPRRNGPAEDLPAVPLTREGLREAARLLRYLWPYRLRFAAAMVALIVSSLCGLAFPAAAGRLVNGALATGAVPWQQDVDTVALVLVALLGVQAASNFAETLWLTEVGQRSLADLRRDTYGHLIALPMSFHVRRRVGELTSRLAADLTQIQDTLTSALPSLLSQAAMFAGGIVLIALTSGRLTLLMLGTFPVLIALAVVFSRFIRRTSRDAQDRLADSQVVVEETLQNIATVKAFTSEAHEQQRYRQGLDAFLDVVLRGALYRGAFQAFVLLALFGAVVLVLWYGTRLIRAGQLSAGDLTSFMLYTLFVASAMGSFAGLFAQLQRTLGATHRVRELLDETPEPLHPVAGPVRKLRGEVAFEHVGFAYPSRPEVEVLRDVSLRAEPGRRVALVGPSGAGKSTAVALLLRFYDPQSGRILIDGKDARDYDLSFLRSQMAVVPQDVLLFGGSIFENIAYGRPGASEEEVVEAARRANAHEFITAFPEGYRTRVGERGVQLSGGQRQRVAIARALLRDPAVLILDEATSSLDAASESLVLQALDRLMEGRTSIVIAHRLSTVRTADRIHVLTDGATVESGTHDELLARPDGVYRTLSRLQFEHAPVETGNGEDTGPSQTGIEMPRAAP